MKTKTMGKKKKKYTAFEYRNNIFTSTSLSFARAESDFCFFSVARIFPREWSQTCFNHSPQRPVRPSIHSNDATDNGRVGSTARGSPPCAIRLSFLVFFFYFIFLIFLLFFCVFIPYVTTNKPKLTYKSFFVPSASCRANSLRAHTQIGSFVSLATASSDPSGYLRFLLLDHRLADFPQNCSQSRSQTCRATESLLERMVRRYICGGNGMRTTKSVIPPVRVTSAHQNSVPEPGDWVPVAVSTRSAACACERCRRRRSCPCWGRCRPRASYRFRSIWCG